MHSSNLPGLRDRFIGRDRAFAELRVALDGPDRLLTLVGPGGVGKTRMALELARDAWPRLQAHGGVWFCDLASATTARDAAGIVGAVFATPTAPRASDDEVLEQIGLALNARGRTLIVADNFEQLTPHAEASLGRWLDAAPGLRIVVTSRRPLGVRGERCVELDPLDADAAATLFLDRARSRAQGFARGPDDDRAVTALVRALEGIPLAIELAAARAALFSPAQMLAGLTRGATLLRNTATPSGRHGSVRASVEWSWSLLSDAQREALARCAVFVGGFDLEAGRELLAVGEAPADDGLDVLEQLRSDSLVYVRSRIEASDENRFDLYASVRDYAAERLDALGLRAEAERRHALYYLREMRAHVVFVDGDDPEMADRIGRERRNLLAIADRFEHTDPALALRAVLTVAPVVHRRGDDAVQTALLDRVTVLSGRVQDAALRAEATLVRGRAMLDRGPLPSARAELDEGLARAERDAVAPVLRGALQWLTGLADALSSEPARGIARLERALAIAHETGDDRLERRVLNALALVYSWTDIERGVAYASQAAAVPLGSRADDYVNVALGSLGTACFELDRLDEAERCWSTALANSRARGDARYVALFLGCLGCMHRARGRYDEAVECLEQSLVAHRAMGNRMHQGPVRSELGVVAFARGDIDGAARHMAEAMLLFRDARYVRHRLIVGAYLAAIEATRDRLETAIGQFAHVRAESATAADPALDALDVIEGFLDLARARAAVIAGDASAAEGHRAAARARIAPDPDPATAPPRRSSDARAARGLLEQALAVAQRDASAQVLEVDAAHRAFRPPHGERVLLAARAPLWRLFACLLASREAKPGTPVSPADAIRAAWPDERLVPRSASNRLHVAVSTLRGLGLRNVLIKQDGGYLLDPAVTVRHGG